MSFTPPVTFPPYFITFWAPSAPINTTLRNECHFKPPLILNVQAFDDLCSLTRIPDYRPP